MASKPKLGFIGTGKVGGTLARLYYNAGYEVAAVYNRTRPSAESLAVMVNAVPVETPLDVVKDAQLVFITVPDDLISEVVETVTGADWQGRAVVHTSGASGTEVLSELAVRGAMVGGLHPIFPFADVEISIQTLPGAAFAIEANNELLRQWLLDMVGIVNGKPILVEAGSKAVYHAALVIASNYTVTLYSVAQSLLEELGASSDAAAHALDTLMQATITNLKAQGIPTALTGPLTRADVGTIQAHLDAIRDKPVLHKAYTALARLSYPMLDARGVNTELIEQVLSQDEEHAVDNS